MNVVTCDAELARDTRLRLWAEHLKRPAEEVADDPARVIDGLWRPTAAQQGGRLRVLPGVSRRAAALRGPLQSLVVDG